MLAVLLRKAWHGIFSPAVCVKSTLLVSMLVHMLSELLDQLFGTVGGCILMFEEVELVFNLCLPNIFGQILFCEPSQSLPCFVLPQLLPMLNLLTCCE